ncbi:MAG TPA: lysylphosphatidylglycerol synthase transmembrane domain-containing protein [Acidimicrobiales bacterium]|nr:lysylphosphatidylglycerol synthase transmembrane domain-containing protein [Acidimicrobiales bacterium]
MGDSEDGSRSRSRGWKIGRAVLSLGLAAAILWYSLDNVGDLSQVGTEIEKMTGWELLTLLLLGAWNLVTYCLVMVAATPGLTYPQALVVTQASTAVSNTVPGGSAISIGLTYAMLGSWGFSKSRATLSTIVSGLWNNFAKLSLPVLALAFLALGGTPSPARVTAGLAGLGALIAAVIVFALILRRETYARRVGDGIGRAFSKVRRIFGKGPVSGWGGATAKFRARTIGLVRQRWLWLTVTTLVSQFSLYLVLLVALRHVGVSDNEVDWAEILAVFAFVRLLTAIPLTPGGLGIIELALISGLTAAGGDKSQVTAAVLIFRFLTYVVPIGLGLLTYLYWRTNKSWRDSAPPLSPSLSPAA